MTKERKQPEPAPPGKFGRSRNGVTARLIKTRRTLRGLWVYRLDYGDVVGNHPWTLPELRAHIVKWFERCPADLRGRMDRRAERKKEAKQ